ncbi:DUF962-domain-containing protein [Phlegmacium glaucopus]|nr:DUF962-domain-containing protein [Phlegmacium glaucopus]
MSLDLFNIEKQFAFYGAYHTNRVNVLIHILCVPLIVWSFQAFLAPFHPPFVPGYRLVINDYMVFETNYATIMAVIYLSYYLLLEPVAALSYVPQMIITVLTATAFGQNLSHTPAIISIHVLCWIAQFIGHGLAEKRAPALLDNLLSAVVLAPFFVHLEILFGLGYRPAMHKRINNAIGMEVAKIRKEEGDRRRKAQ